MLSLATNKPCRVDSDDAVVANVVSEEAETAGALAGLDLHALASVDVDIVRLEGPPSPAMSSASRC